MIERSPCTFCGHSNHNPGSCSGVSSCECGRTDLPCVCDEADIAAPRAEELDVERLFTALANATGMRWDGKAIAAEYARLYRDEPPA